nr:MAG TPA: Cytochrome c oxidase subunit 1 [Caudoviricetes sp.]
MPPKRRESPLMEKSVGGALFFCPFTAHQLKVHNFGT